MHVVIIGNGIAGVTTAIALRKRQRTWKITLISGESDAFFSRTALMYIYMGHMRLQDTQPYEAWFWREKRLDRVRGWVAEIDLAAHRLRLDDGRTVAWDKLVVATGSQPNRFGWPGQDLPGVGGLYSLQDLEALERHSVGARAGVVVGGGLIGIELAEMLHSRGMRVSILARESAYWNNALPRAEAELVGQVIREAHVELQLGTALAEVEPDASGHAAYCRTDAGARLPAQVVGLTAGVRPNLGVVRGSGLATGRGVLVDTGLRTAHPDVFACGDCAEICEAPTGESGAPGSTGALAGPGRIEQLWYTGRMQGEVCAENVSGGDARYDRGIWFNSAKFFDLEWHTYGRVRGETEGPDAAERHFLWQDLGQRRLLRLVERDGALVGVNALGLRQRQAVWTRWIGEKRPVADVVPHLAEANFDPEFTRRSEREVAGAFKEQLR